jgi:FemAB-related protein (PEP-CTERM system-associated)
MKVVHADASHKAAWNRFVDEAPEGSLYHRFEWKEITERVFGHDTCWIAAEDASGIAGVLPLVRLKSPLFGSIACSLPFVNYGGPVAVTTDVEAALLDEAQRVADGWRVDYVELRCRRDLGDSYPSADHKVSMTVALDKDPDVLWKGFKTSHRQDIRRAYKYGLTAKVGGAELFDDFYGILCESWRDLGTPILSRKYLSSVVAAFPQTTRICIVYSGEERAAAALSGLHRGTAEGMWLGTRSKFRSQMAGYILYWELIKDACEQGLQRYHLGRSTAQSGAEAFKKKWNAELTQLYWHYILRTRRDVPRLNPQNPRYRLAINTWRRLPLSVTRLVGPVIARSIP